ncbi:hypothetical protein [Agromyces aerolatus]|uniref:hypothetical protein n=1 Tax=Agromyces sp. LY-1074 TaxID=3074080 RepID=UPI00285FAE8B|nr:MULTISPECIES: hypothetical protein [unclassified Agromyces]MDR5701543.1 hypothetical protein [Agromyces sp. LY-1074]MDR5707850.1 hypothetical protein [Agromyces sp. LY-1358]
MASQQLRDARAQRRMVLALTTPAFATMLLAIVAFAVAPGYAIAFVVPISAVFIFGTGLCIVFRARLARVITERHLSFSRALAITSLLWLVAALLAPIGSVGLSWLLLRAVQAFVQSTYDAGGSLDVRVYLTTFAFGLPTVVTSLVISPVLLVCVARRSRRGA